MERVIASTASESASSKWWICGVLLLASALNYMDRLTLAVQGHQIKLEYKISDEQYGNLETGFGWAFAIGSLAFGFAADRLPLRWTYPAILALWSSVGFATGQVHSYSGLLACRTALGFFEAGHWPCAIKATQRLLSPKDRAMGNGVLQSGASIGAILTPPLMYLLIDKHGYSWQFAFQVVGLLGIAWVILWFALVRKNTLDLPAAAGKIVSATGPSVWKMLASRRMLVILIVIALINTCWQILRAWLPKFLEEGRAYTPAQAKSFTSLYYIVTDIGCLGAGAMTVWLYRRKLSVHSSRLLVFFIFAALSASAAFIPFLPAGPFLLIVLLLVGAGSLGVFPVYHALSQEVSAEHQGMVTGVAGIAAWGFSFVHSFFGKYIDQTKSFDRGLALIGWTPLLAFLFLLLLWDHRGSRAAEKRAEFQAITPAGD
jgi:ACS family hexuronate transporter-like MFS transporter